MHKLATAYSGSAAWIASTTMASDCESESSASSTLCPVLIVVSASAACSASAVAPRVLAAPFNE